MEYVSDLRITGACCLNISIAKETMGPTECYDWANASFGSD